MRRGFSAAAAIRRATINVKDFGAVGDGVRDDAASIQAAVNAAKDIGPVVRVSADPYFNHDHRGIPVFFPPGNYAINTPIILPRSGLYRANAVGLVGESAVSCRISAGAAFPDARALIEWEITDTTHNDVRDQVIANLNLVPKSSVGSMAIHFALVADRSVYGTDVNAVDTIYHSRFENLIVFGYNQYHQSLIRLEGRLDFSDIRDLTADTAILTATYSTRLLHFDDLTLWPLMNTSANRILDAPGANFCHIQRLWSGHRGGYHTGIYGRVNASTIDTFNLHTGAGTNPALYIRDGGVISGRSWTAEGGAEDGVYTFENCIGVTVSGMQLPRTDLATAEAPGSALRLINCQRMEFSNRQVATGMPANSSDSGSKLVRVDGLCKNVRFLRFAGTAAFELEFDIDAAATNVQVDYEDILTGVRTQWGPPVLVGAHLAPTGYYMTPEGTRGTGLLIANQEWAIPIKIGRDCSVDRIAVEVTTVGAAGSVIRLGVRDSTTDNRPGALLLDAGTVAGDAVAVAEIALGSPLRLRKPGTYWLTAAAQNVSGTAPTIRTVTTSTLTPSASATLSAAFTATANTGYNTSTTVTGALPATFTVLGRIGGAPLIALRGA